MGGADDRHDRHRLGQVAVLQPADARRAVHRRQGARALPLPDEGAEPGPGARAARLRAAQAGPPGDLHRRHQAGGPPGHPPAREPRAHQPRHAAHRDPAPPRALGRLLRQPRRGRRRRGPRLPRRLRLARRQRAAPAAPRGRRLRDRSRGSCWPAPRSPTPSSWPSASPASTTSRWSTATAPRARAARSRCGTRPSPTRRCRRGAARWPRRPRWWPSWCAAARGRSASSRAARRSSWSRGRCATSSSRTTRSWPTASRPTAPATRPSSAASSRPG